MSLPSLPPPPGTRVSRFRLGAAGARWIVPPGPLSRTVILYFHGGGWLYGWLFIYDRFVARAARACGCRALGVEYRLAPAHPFPAALDDCRAAWDYLLSRGTPAGNIVLMGDSAGANLALALLLDLKARGKALPRAAVCLSPPTDLAAPDDDGRPNAAGDCLLSPSFARLAKRSYTAGRDPRNPLISPARGDLSGLPPILIQAGGAELLRADADAFAARARAAGVGVTLSVFPGLWHVFQASHPGLPESKRALGEIGRFVRAVTDRR